MRQEEKPSERSFDDIAIGESFSKEINVTSKMIDEFAAFSGDTNPLHTEPDFAREKGFRDRVAHGTICSCLFSEMVGMHLPGKNSLLIKTDLNFKEPVYSGDELIIEAKVASKNFGKLVSLDAQASRKSDGKICVSGTLIVKMLI